MVVQGSNFSRLHEKDLDTLERRRREDEKSFVFDSNVSVFFSVPFLPQHTAEKQLASVATLPLYLYFDGSTLVVLLVKRGQRHAKFT